MESEWLRAFANISALAISTAAAIAEEFTRMAALAMNNIAGIKLAIPVITQAATCCR